MNSRSLFKIPLVGLVILALGGFLAVNHGEGSTGIPAPDISNATWLNSQPLQLADLKGKVVLVEFWTFGCYNCHNVEPYIKEWHQKYAEQGLVVIAVHSPEFSYEESVSNVKNYVKDHDIEYAVPIDNDFVTWKKYRNRYWPTVYLIDKKGTIQYVKIGEGGYHETERRIRQLLAQSS